MSIELIVVILLIPSYICLAYALKKLSTYAGGYIKGYNDGFNDGFYNAKKGSMKAIKESEEI